MSVKLLKEKNPNSKVAKAYFKPYDYTITTDQDTYHVKVLSLSRSTILSINSKYVWEIRRGKADGISFKTYHTARLDMTDFNKLSNRIIVCKDQPYKVLQYINESEVKDISGVKEVFDTKIFYKLRDVEV